MNNTTLTEVDRDKESRFIRGITDKREKTKEQASTSQATKTLRPLTRKQEAFVKELVNNPKQSATQAVKKVYDVSTENSASQIATDNLRKPQIMAELAKYSNTAEYNLIKLANKTTDYALEGGREGAMYASVAEKTNNSILDRLHGKATTKIEQRSIGMVITVDLSGQEEETE